MIERNWNYDRTPKTESARLAIELVEHTLRLIDELQPTFFFIENPHGMLLKIPQVEHLKRHTVTYCQYGDTRMKPTDIWTNAKYWTPRPICKNGAPCHVAAPRGSKTGTQGLKGVKNRGRIPPDFFKEIFSALATKSHRCIIEDGSITTENPMHRGMTLICPISADVRQCSHGLSSPSGNQV